METPGLVITSNSFPAVITILTITITITLLSGKQITGAGITLHVPSTKTWTEYWNPPSGVFQLSIIGPWGMESVALGLELVMFLICFTDRSLCINLREIVNHTSVTNYTNVISSLDCFRIKIVVPN